MKKQAMESREGEAGDVSAMDGLPIAVLQTVLTRLDVASLCSASATSRLLHSAVLQLLPHLIEFHLEDFSLDKQLLENLISCNMSLLSLKLDCSYLDNRSWKLLTKPQLRELFLRNCDNFSGFLLAEIGRCQYLRSLTIQLGWRDESEKSVLNSGLQTLLRNCNLLEIFSLKYEGPGFDTQVLEGLLQMISPKVKVLEIGSISNTVAEQMILTGGNRCRNLQRISLVVNQISDSLVSAIAENLHHLTEIELRDECKEEPNFQSELTNGGMQKLGLCSELKLLSLVRSEIWYAATFKRVNDLGLFLLLEQLENLESIRLGGFSRITDASCGAILHKCSKLHTFELLNTKQLTDLAFHDLGAALLNLSTVNLTANKNISDFSVRHLAYHCKTTLQVLNLRGCRSIGDESLKAIASAELKNLSVLILNGSDVSDFGLYPLAKSRVPLVSLSLRSCGRITDDGVIALLHGETAKTLQSIDLSGIPQVSDKSVMEMVRCGMRVVNLWLRNCQMITDTSVVALASMHFEGRRYGGTVRVLDLWMCKKVSKAAVRWFKKPYFPGLRWLGLNRVLASEVKALVMQQRRVLQVRWQGSELGYGASSEGDDDVVAHHNEEFDELERWLDDDDDDDVNEEDEN